MKYHELWDDLWAEGYCTIHPGGAGDRFVDMPDEDRQDTQFLPPPGTTCLDNNDVTVAAEKP